MFHPLFREEFLPDSPWISPICIGHVFELSLRKRILRLQKSSTSSTLSYWQDLEASDQRRYPCTNVEMQDYFLKKKMKIEMYQNGVTECLAEKTRFQKYHDRNEKLRHLFSVLLFVCFRTFFSITPVTELIIIIHTFHRPIGEHLLSCKHEWHDLLYWPKNYHLSG